jgi:hypothetical protein
VTIIQRTNFAIASILAAWLQDGIKQERQTLTAELAAEGIQTSRALLGTTVLGTISLRKGTTGHRVTDEDELEAYIAETYPHTVIPAKTVTTPAHIEPLFRDHLLKRLVATDDGLIDPETGVVLPVERTTGEPSLAFKPEADARDIVLRAFAAGELDPIRALMEGSE